MSKRRYGRSLRPGSPPNPILATTPTKRRYGRPIKPKDWLSERSMEALLSDIPVVTKLPDYYIEYAHEEEAVRKRDYSIYFYPIFLYDTHDRRLILNTRSNSETNSPPLRYAILSHRWGATELTYPELARGEVDEEKHDKFVQFCRIAQDYGCRYVWIDTACIRKDVEHSGEFDDSIQSMFHWYQSAFVCIVYLGDSERVEDIEEDTWFTRGWTLQELLAPKRMAFFLRDWSRLDSSVPFDIFRRKLPASDDSGARDEFDCSRELQESISRATGIEQPSLVSYKPHPKNLDLVLGWVRQRNTTEPEDIAYCLVSLLLVRLATAYGEGVEKALARLRSACEIIKDWEPLRLSVQTMIDDRNDVLSHQDWLRNQYRPLASDPNHQSSDIP